MPKKQFAFALLLTLFFFEPFLLFSKGKKPKHMEEESQPVSETETTQTAAPTETTTQPATPQASSTGEYVITETEDASAPTRTETPAETETVIEELPAETVTEEAPAEIPEGSKIHVVWIWQETQDCLWNLAKQYYGDPWQWKKIYLANKNWILDPKLIFPKQRIVIPPNQ